MISLTYISTASKDFERTELEELLAQARSNNERLGVTGMMLHVGGHFVQTLEGEDEVVDELFATVAKDLRHHDVSVMLRERVSGGSFEDWSMGFEQVSDEDAAQIPGFNQWLQPGIERSRFRHSRAGIFFRLISDYPR